ncbi:MAG: beta-glucosidase [Paludibacteraceae bacterium]|nr:beta-glucosidase [Paludibacteraceae bacterium]
MKKTLLLWLVVAMISQSCSSGRKAQPLSDDALLDTVELYTSRYFTDFINPANGLARERADMEVHGDIVTTGGTGFGLMAIVAAAERQYIPREQAVAQLDNITRFLDRVERFHGAWAHWYASETEQAYPFSKYDDGGDLVETAFLTEGLLVVREWLRNSEVEAEQAVAQRADKLWKEVEWDWYTQGTDSLYWHWSKNYGWKMNHRIKGFDECLITYVLAASSPTHPIERKVYEACYKNSSYYYNGKEYYGIPLALGMEYGGPLFFTHYSWLGLNPHGLTDGEVNYFERNRAHALIHYNYALDNPKHHTGYGANLWGFTSSDDALVGYCSHHPGTPDENGTVSPTAAVSSIVYTPEESMAVIRHLYEDLGEQLFGEYGFYDAYNPSLPEQKQVVRHYLAIDQGPIVVMIENYRSGLIWKLFMQAPEIQTGLERLGFRYEE